MGKLILLFSVLAAGPATLGAQVGPPPPPPGPLQPPPVPAGNPQTSAKLNLGQALFWDEQLSSSRVTACGTCHIPNAGGSDPRSILGDPVSTHPGADGLFGTDDDVTGSPGVPQSLANGHYTPAPPFGIGRQVTGRKAPSAINAAYSAELFWDGRAGPAFSDPLSGTLLLPSGGALENQALGPPVSSAEMGHLDRDWNDVAARVAASVPLALSPSVPAPLSDWIAGRSYPELFAEAWVGGTVTPARIAMAIASYERTLFSDQAPIDFAVPGSAVLTPLEQQGRQLFGQLGCGGCHTPPLFSDNLYHYIGVRPAAEDPGRFAVTGSPFHLGAMRTPSLRNVELRAPYMHDGRFNSLAEVVEFYDRGGDFDAPNKAPAIVPLGLTPGEKSALVAFLGNPLTDPRVELASGPFERPLLASESDRVPTLYGSPSPGPGGALPQAVAFEPSAHDNPNLTFGVQHGAGGAFAWLALDLSASEGLALKGVTSWLGLTPAMLILPMGPLLGPGPGQGFLSAAFDLQGTAAPVGVELFGQWFLVQPTPGGPAFSASEGFAFTLF